MSRGEHPLMGATGRGPLTGFGLGLGKSAKGESDPGDLTRENRPIGAISAGAQERRSAGAPNLCPGGRVMVAPPPKGALRPCAPHSAAHGLGRGLGTALASALLSLAPHPFLAAAPLALPLLIGFAPGAQAQTTTLVSNTGETASTNTNNPFSTRFTTGANSTGYTISSVDIYITSAAPVVTIRADGTDPTGTVIATLTAPATITANAVNTFTAPVNTVLAANTTYWLRVDATSTARVSLTNSDDETGATGWSISNSGGFLSGGSWFSIVRLVDGPRSGKQPWQKKAIQVPESSHRQACNESVLGAAPELPS